MNILAHDPRSRKEGICFSRRGARMFTTHDAPLDLSTLSGKASMKAFTSLSGLILVPLSGQTAVYARFTAHRIPLRASSSINQPAVLSKLRSSVQELLRLLSATTAKSISEVKPSNKRGAHHSLYHCKTSLNQQGLVILC